MSVDVIKTKNKVQTRTIEHVVRVLNRLSVSNMWVFSVEVFSGQYHIFIYRTYLDRS